MVSRGQKVKVKVLSFTDSQPRPRISLSMKEVDQTSGEDLFPRSQPGKAPPGAESESELMLRNPDRPSDAGDVGDGGRGSRGAYLEEQRRKVRRGVILLVLLPSANFLLTSRCSESALRSDGS